MAATTPADTEIEDDYDPLDAFETCVVFFCSAKYLGDKAATVAVFSALFRLRLRSGPGCLYECHGMAPDPVADTLGLAVCLPFLARHDVDSRLPPLSSPAPAGTKTTWTAR